MIQKSTLHAGIIWCDKTRRGLKQLGKMISMLCCTVLVFLLNECTNLFPRNCMSINWCWILKVYLDMCRSDWMDIIYWRLWFFFFFWKQWICTWVIAVWFVDWLRSILEFSEEFCNESSFHVFSCFYGYTMILDFMVEEGYWGPWNE